MEKYSSFYFNRSEKIMLTLMTRHVQRGGMHHKNLDKLNYFFFGGEASSYSNYSK